MLKHRGQASIFEAKLWMASNFDKVLHKRKLGYSDGTGGQADIPISIRPAAFGAATFNYKIENGEQMFEDIEGLGGEVPGEQIVPRAEAWAATIIMSRVHPNAVARFGIDAAYVVNGTSKRRSLEKGKNWDIWALFFAILDMRTAELGVAKITSHLEDIALEAIQADAAYLCDIVGNALADESAAIAAKLLRPETSECAEADQLQSTAFLICIRLGFTKARIWELTNDAPIYEAPPDLNAIDLTFGSNYSVQPTKCRNKCIISNQQQGGRSVDIAPANANKTETLPSSITG